MNIEDELHKRVPPAPNPAAHAADPLSLGTDEVVTPQRLRVMQIIAGTLLLFLVGATALGLYIVQVKHGGQGIGPPRDVSLLTLVAVAMLALDAPLAFLIPRMLTRSALRRIATGTWLIPPGVNPADFATTGAKLMAVQQTAMIVGMALLQGPALVACLAYLQEAQALALGVIGLALVLMLCKFPTKGRVWAWLARGLAAAFGKPLVSQRKAGGVDLPHRVVHRFSPKK